MTPHARWARGVRNTSAALFVLLLSASVLAGPSGAAATPGSAGTNTALPHTSSVVTVHGRGEFDGLEITVNQTEELVNQAISISWKGATPTRRTPVIFGEQYLQVMQCWGEPDDAVPANPGPPPEQCEFGAANGSYGGRPIAGNFPNGSQAISRAISRTDFADHYVPGDGVVDQRNKFVWRPFRAVSGEEVGIHEDPSFNPAVEGGRYWLNPYFDAATTNELPGARTRPNGSGEELFEVTTGKEAPGLGCGQRVEPVAGGSPKVPRCWLVIVPRGSAADENLGIPIPGAADGSIGVYTSPLTTRSWKNRIAIELEFQPADSNCDITKDARRLGGSELAIAAISSWQPVLCATGDLPPYTFANLGDVSGRAQLLSEVSGTPGMVVLSRPVDPALVKRENPVLYAPLTLSAAAIGFNLERVPRLTEDVPQDEQDLQGVRVAELNLTPRLVAKLLTQSYLTQTAIKATQPYTWNEDNPESMGQDPDFLQFNPEFEYLLMPNAKTFGGLYMPLVTSDLATQVWEWILADPEAKAWLDGEPDEFGMVVNPVYSTTANAANGGVPFGEPVPDRFPKSDPYCYQAPSYGPDNSVVPPPLCGNDWVPYSDSLRNVARIARTGDDGSRTSGPDPFARDTSQVYRGEGPQRLGERAMLAMVDTPLAHRYGLQIARLSRAGDDGDDRAFIAPTPGSTTEAVENAMVPSAVPEVVVPDPEADAPGAYPLTTLTYAAIDPLSLDEAAQAEYAAFLAYGVGDGQIEGLEIGKLPEGYTPLPPAMREQSETVVGQITTLQPPSDETPPTTTPTTTPSGSSVTIPSVITPRSNTPSFNLPSVPVVATTAPPAGEEEPEETIELGPLTPILALAQNRFVLPVLAVIALLSALVGVEITRRPGAQPTLPGGAA